jgi:hypothetical protein
MSQAPEDLLLPSGSPKAAATSFGLTKTVSDVLSEARKQRLEKYYHNLDLTKQWGSMTYDEYADTKAYIYRRDRMCDYSLWTAFKKDIEGWTEKTFMNLTTPTKNILRQTLRREGVVVKRIAHCSQPRRFFEILEEEEPIE